MDYTTFEAALRERYGEGNAMFSKGGAWVFACCEARPNSCMNQPKIIRELWENASDFDSFLNAMHHDERLRLTSQAWAEFAKLEGWSVPFGDGAVRIATHSNRGEVKIGDLAGTCAFGVDNGYGDGITSVFIAEEGQINTSWFSSVSMIEGEFQVYGYDCDPLAPATEESTILSGKYLVYARAGIVAFVRM